MKRHQLIISTRNRQPSSVKERWEGRLVRCATTLLILCCLTFMTAPVLAQTIQNAQNSVDFKLRNDARIDPSTLSLQLQIPLGNYPGRGGASLPITLYYSSKLWRMDYLNSTTEADGGSYSRYTAEYSESSASGWTSSLDFFRWLRPGPPGIEKYNLSGKAVAGPLYDRTVARIHVTLPDGSRHELRRSDQVLPAGSDVYTGTFYAVDGSRLRYESATRTLFLPDGSRLIDETDANGISTFKRYIDRNGNENVYSYATGQWTDTLGRTFGLPLPIKTNIRHHPPVGDLTYSLPGVGVSTLTYTFRWRSLNDTGILEQVNGQTPALRCKGDVRTTACPAGALSLFNSPDSEKRVYTNEGLFNPVVLAELVLPNGAGYKFKYNVYGEIVRIEYPTGGFENFVHDVVDSVSGEVADAVPASGGLYSQANRGVVVRVVSAPDVSGGTATWKYETSIDSNAIPHRLTRKIIAPDDSYTETLYHQSRGANIKFGFDDARAGKPFDERAYAAPPDQYTPGRMLRRTLTDWIFTGPVPFDNNSTATRDARPRKSVDILLDTSGDALASTTVYGYDNDLNVTLVRKYRYKDITRATAETGSIESFPTPADTELADILRVEETDYLTNEQAYRDRNMLSMPVAVRVKGIINGVLTLISQSEMKYDETALSPNSGVTNWSAPPTTARGNLTKRRAWINTSETWIESRIEYDQCGSPVKTLDARGKVSLVEYSADNKYAFPTKTTSAVPDSSGAYASADSFITTSVYDARTGLLRSTTDANGQTTSMDYNDALHRLTRVERPDGGETSYEYGDTAGNFYIRSRTKLDASRSTDAYQYFDGLGRPERTYSYDGNALLPWSVAETKYDRMGRVWQSSNPARVANQGDPVGTAEWTTTEYDALGRVITLTTPDNAKVITAYEGTQVMVTDQASKSRRSETDALGRLTQVIEYTRTLPDPGTVAAPNSGDYQTDYEYDALGNLRKVTQGAQQRFFHYDSLSRLLRAKNPEQDANASLALSSPDPVTNHNEWSSAYSYDENSNLKTRTDARGIITSYNYDDLNRNTTIDYSTTTTTNPDVTRRYDGAGVSGGILYAKGQLTHVGTEGAFVSSYTYDTFDVMGRVKQSTQTTESNPPYVMGYVYDVAGNMYSQTYPSGRIVTTSFDGAGRTSGVTGQKTGEANKTYASAVSYTAHGAVSDLQLGNQLWEHTIFNSRLQPTEIGLGTTRTDSSKFKLAYDYGTTNNGNVQSQTITIPGGPTLSQTYTYDALNRIETAVELNGTNSSWKQKFLYDRFGNRTIDGNPADTTPEHVGPNPAINPANNRIAAAGYGYDLAGNLTSTPGVNTTRTYEYDAENRQTVYKYGTTTEGLYDYDGDGRRVKKFAVTATGPATTFFVYNVLGQVVAEYSSAAAAANGTQYLTSDTLGTPRVVTLADGAVKSRHDYLPFGEEIVAEVGGRTGQGYGQTDNIRQQFTGKERDGETGLDYFLARYYSSTQGRFTSPDEFQGGARELFVLGSGHPEKQALAYADIFTPQSLNKYQYCLNNPLRYVDPDGHDYRIVEEKDKNGKRVKRYVWDREYTWKKGDKNGAPPNARYIDTQGRAIQLWGDNKKDLSKGKDHGYQVVEPTAEGGEEYVNQQGEAPTSFVTYRDTRQAVLNAGYKQHYLDIHPDHWGGEDFSKPSNPTLHITLFHQQRIGGHSRSLPAIVTSHLPLKDATFHTDKHTQAGSWGDAGRHLKEASRKAVGLKP